MFRNETLFIFRHFCYPWQRRSNVEHKFCLTLFHLAIHRDSISYCCYVSNTLRMISSRCDEQYTSVELLNRLHNIYPAMECPSHPRFLSLELHTMFVMWKRIKEWSEYVRKQKLCLCDILNWSFSREGDSRVFGWIYWFNVFCSFIATKCWELLTFRFALRNEFELYGGFQGCQSRFSAVFPVFPCRRSGYTHL